MAKPGQGPHRVASCWTYIAMWSNISYCLPKGIRLSEPSFAPIQVTVQGLRKRRLQDVARAVYRVSTWPQLYIYSPADHVIPHSAVKRWMQVRIHPY